MNISQTQVALLAFHASLECFEVVIVDAKIYVDLLQCFQDQ